MDVSLVWKTSNGEQLIADMARVSTNKIGYDYTKLFKYLIKHKHWSPFEMANMCIKIKCPRYLSTQIIRHKSFSFQEFSQRYSTVNVENQYTLTFRNKEGDYFTNATTQLANEQIKEINKTYEDLINNGCSYETARQILPLSTHSTLYMNGNIRSWIHYFQSRMNDDAQLEHQYLASLIYNIFSKEFPTISALIFNE